MAEEFIELKEPFTPKIDVAQERGKPRLEALVFCEYHTQDQQNKTVLAGCFDRIFAHPVKKQTGLFNLWVRTAETREGQVIVTIFDPDNTLFANIAFEIPEPHVTPDFPFHAQFLARLALPVEKKGIYWVDVSYKDESLGGVALAIEFLEVAEEAEKGGAEHEHERAGTT